MARRKRKISHIKLPAQRQLAFLGEGRYFDLNAIFAKLNRKYFGGSLRRYTIMWGRKRKLPPREYFIFGTIQEEDRVIRIHPLMDAPFVPQWFMEYVIYHEMLHSIVPDKFDKKGRRIVHHEGFNRREKKFPAYRRAKRWEEDNLARFLR